jgi:hypothetical protein
MNRSVSVSQLCNRSLILHICGYSEEVLDNLIQDGHLQGYFDYKSGEMMVDTSAVQDFLSFEEERHPNWESKQDERADDFSNLEGLL